MTSCRQPKKSLEYKSNVFVVKGSELTSNGYSIVSLSLSYKDYRKTINEEITVYDTPGLVYQLGGVISLFLGISFFTIICDLLDCIKEKI